MSVPYHDPRVLWSKSPDDFNAWRAGNDIPLLLAFFIKRLPHFQQWMDEHGVDDVSFCALVPTGDWLAGEAKKLIVRDQNDQKTHTYLKAYTPNPEDTMEQLRGRIDTTNVVTEIDPYLSWARSRLGADRLFSIDGVNPGKASWPVFNLWSATFGLGANSRAYLLSEFEVLKMGGVEIGNMVQIGARNLDFTDLDFLTIEGQFHGSYLAPINFSSCRNFRINQTEVNFLRLYRCSLEDWECKESRLYDISFTECGVFGIKFLSCYLHKISFVSSLIRPTFSNCELREFSFLPSREFGASGVADVYRLLRGAYQQGGQTQEASEHYYLERTYRRKALFYPYNDYPALCPPMSRGIRPRDIPQFIEKGIVTETQRMEQIKAHRKFIFSIWTTPRFARHALWFKAKWLASWIDNALWGYGERPLRIFSTATFVILTYAGLYAIWRDSLNVASNGVRYSLIDCLYFSLVTFSTLGYGDITPKEQLMKLLCGSEAIMGAFIMGLVVAGFANKSRY